MKNDNTSLTSIDLFAGAGGLSLGLKEAGFHTLCAVEIDPFSAQTFARHTPDAEVHCRDIVHVDLWKYHSEATLVCGGPPCQPFSSGGLRKSSEDDRDMVRWFVNAVKAIQPKAFLLENVPGLSVGTRRSYLDRVIDALKEIGYYVVWKVLNAADYGVPQNRRRLIVIGLHNQPFTFPTPTHGPGREHPYCLVRDVISTHPVGQPNRAKITYAKKPDLRPNPYHGLLFNGGGRPINLDEPAPTILATAGGNKTPFLDTLGIVPQYHTHLLKGGQPSEGELPGARRLTLEEVAKLQTFPSDICFAGPKSAQYRQVGNAVPPRLAEILGVAIAEQLNGSAIHGTRGSHNSVQTRLFASSLTTFMAKSNRNANVHEAVTRALDRIDFFLDGGTLSELPPKELRRAADQLLGQSASIRTAALFLTFFKLVEPTYDFTRLPIGLRGQYGDKLLCEELTQRDITLHNAITAYGENIGAKGDVSTFNLSGDIRLGPFARSIAVAEHDDVDKVANYLASTFASSQRIMPAIPSVGEDILTFSRAKALFHKVIRIESEGFIPQFVIAALLREAHERQGIEVITHHPHASDRSDKVAGDIEERIDGTLHRAYEVTVRPDWKNRISGFTRKMREYELKKYVIIASDVNEDSEWAEPASLALKLDVHGQDIAVVDILDVLNVLAAELSARDLRNAINHVQEYLRNRRLCGRFDIVKKYTDAVDDWLDSPLDA